MVILQKRFIKDISRDRKSAYVVYIYIYIYIYIISLFLITRGVTIESQVLITFNVVLKQLSMF